MVDFNPRSHEGSDRPNHFQVCIRQDFNPRSHEGSDLRLFWQVGLSGDFNPRSHEGSDFYELLSRSKCRHFNPRSHEGSDMYDNPYRVSNRISIHAPTRGATIKQVLHLLQLLFQSTLPRGERHRGNHRNGVSERFQSTLPRGERPLYFLRVRKYNYFNPRSHEGSDARRSWYCPGRSDFNPRSHEGSDTKVILLHIIATISIHAPTRGATV